MHDQDNFDDDEWVSKSQIKREAQALKDLGRELSELSDSNLKQIPMSEVLYESLLLAKRLQAKKEREGLRRHFNYVGKLLRESDIDAINLAMDKIRNRHLYAAQAQSRMEKLAQQVVSQGDDLVNLLMEDHPSFDRQRLRQLVRAAKKEHEQQKPGKSTTELVRYLKEHIEE